MCARRQSRCLIDPPFLPLQSKISMKLKVVAGRWVVSCLLIMALAGCSQTDAIQTYEVAKDRSGLDEFDVPETGSESTAPGRAHRMVVAIARAGETAWFFKLEGAPEAVDSVASQWAEFLASIRFDEQGRPIWTLPEKWSEGDPAPMRFATVLAPTPDGEMLEVKVSSLAAAQDWSMNVNRWRNQLGLPPADDASGLLVERNFGEQAFLIFDQTGNRSGGSAMMSPPFAGAASAPPTGEATGKVTFESPAGWTEVEPGPVADLRLRKETADGQAQITITRLPAAANDWPSNAARWAREVEGPDDPSELEALTQSVTIDGASGYRLDLLGDETAPRATMGVMVVRGDVAWFIKLTGDRKVVVDSADDFERFLESVRLP